MTLSLTLACVWGLLANVVAMLPSKDYHWRWAYLLMALGAPVVGFVAWEMGPWVAALVLVAGASILRWPVIYLGRWLRARLGRA